MSDDELTPKERRRLGLRIPTEPGQRKTRDQRVIEAVERWGTGPRKLREAEVIECLGISDDADEVIQPDQPDPEEDQVDLRGGLNPRGSDPQGWQHPTSIAPYGKSGNRWNSITDPQGERL